MAIVVTQPAVGTSATLICQNTAGDPGEGDYRTRRFRIKNVTATAPVFIGPAGVTTANGYSFATADSPIVIELEPGEALYGIVTTTTQTLHVIQHGR